jgi:hypothetical protein
MKRLFEFLICKPNHLYNNIDELYQSIFLLIVSVIILFIENLFQMSFLYFAFTLFFIAYRCSYWVYVNSQKNKKVMSQS